MSSSLAIAAIAGAAFAANPSARIDARIGSFAQVRSADEGGAVPARLGIDPSLVALLRAGGFEVEATATPRLIADTVGGSLVAVEPWARADVTWDPSPGWVGFSGAQFRWGRESAFAARPDSDWRDAWVAWAPELGRFLEMDAYFGAQREVRRGLRVLAGGSHYSGGFTDAAAMEMVHAPGAFAAIDWDLTRRDRLTTRAQYGATFLDADWSSATTRLSTRWRRELTRTLSGFVDGGVALIARAADADLGTRPAEWRPVAVVGIEKFAAWRTQDLRLRGRAGYEPRTSRIDGDRFQQVDASAEAIWTLRRTWSLRGMAGVSLPAFESRGESLALLEVAGGWRTRSNLMVEAGVRAQRGEVPLPVGPRSGWLGFVSASWTVEDLF